MKIFKIFTLLVVVLSFSACETYDDAKVEYSSIALMSGEWKVTVRDVVADTMVVFSISDAGVKNYRTVIYTYNTADESTTQMWLRMGTATAPTAKIKSFAVKGKVDIALNAKTFSAKDAIDAYLTTNSKFQVTDGKVVLDGADTPSGYKADAISFTITTDRTPNRTYEIKGFRRTGWPEDE